MEHCEGRALRTAANPPRYGLGLWMTPGSFNKSSKQEFLEHINKLDPAIKFTIEGTQGNGATLSLIP